MNYKPHKLTIVFRVEPGCLGPDGDTHIDNFCKVAQKDIEPIDADIIHWEIIPRHDKALPELQYKISNKTLTPVQAAKYLALFNKNTDELETHLHDILTHSIDQYLGH